MFSAEFYAIYFLWNPINNMWMFDVIGCDFSIKVTVSIRESEESNQWKCLKIKVIMTQYLMFHIRLAPNYRFFLFLRHPTSVLHSLYEIFSPNLLNIFRYTEKCNVLLLITQQICLLLFVSHLWIRSVLYAFLIQVSS